ncbi:hypothetical protein ACFTAO_43410 [Paenibacillus rhizoplanae]
MDYTVYVALADASGNWSGVTPLQLKTAASTATSLTQVGVTSIGTVTAEVYAAYGQMSAPVTPLKYVVVKATDADPTAMQISQAQNSAGASLMGPWAGTITGAPVVKT